MFFSFLQDKIYSPEKSGDSEVLLAQVHPNDIVHAVCPGLIPTEPKLCLEGFPNFSSKNLYTIIEVYKNQIPTMQQLRGMSLNNFLLFPVIIFDNYLGTAL